MVFQRMALLLPIALIAALSTAPARAQSTDATLRGTVRDPAKAPIVSVPVTITATNQATKASRTTTTEAGGTYSISIAPGSYSVKAEAPGFWGESRSIDVVAGGPNLLDLTLTPTMSEKVTVTATKIETAPIDVPFSLAVRTEQELRERGADNIEEVSRDVVSFTVQNLGPGQSQVAMRGVSAGQIARDQPGVKEQVGIYLDESAISLSLFTPDLDLVDVNRVEVLRGPQGTLYGAGSVTGTVRYVTNQPALGQNETFLEVGAATVEEGSEAGDVKAGVNVPLGDQAALRVVGYYSHLPGYIDAVQPDLSVDRDVNDGFRSGARAAITMTPNDKLTITPRVVYQKVKSYGWNNEDAYNILANPFTTTRPAVELDDREQFIQKEEDYSDNFVLGDLTIKYDFGKLLLTSISSYIDRDILVIRDTTALTASFTGGTAGFPEPIFTLTSPMYDNTKATMWTQELRLSAEQGKWQWLAGIFYSNAERDYGQNVTVPGFEDATGIPTTGVLAPKDSIYFSDLGYDLDQFALFGEATLSPTPHFSLTGGLRYYNFSEDKTTLIDGAFAVPPSVFGTGVVSLPGSTSADGFAPRLIGTWKLSDDAIFNAQVSKGFRLGGINDPLNVALCSSQDLMTFGGHDNWDDESVWNYEVGYKSRFMAGRGSFNASAFYMDIRDLQTTVTAGTCSSRVVFNVPNAHSQGLELEFAATPNRSFDFAISGSFIDSKLDSTLTSDDGLGNVTVVSGIEAGRRLPSVPELQIAASATYQWEVGKSAHLYLTGAYQHVGSRFTQVGDQDLGTLNMTTLPNTIGGPLTQNTFTYEPELPAYDLVNLRVGLRRAEWDLSVYVNNVTNELALLSFDRERGTLARIGYLTNQPRTCGIATRFNF